MKTCILCGGALRTIKDQPYEYFESGLRVVLLGITQYKCDACGETYAALPDATRLHTAIGIDICRNKKGLLLPEEIKFLRKELRLKSKELAATLGVTDSTVSRLENGKTLIGEGQDRLLRSIYLSCTEAHNREEQSCDCHINLFKNLPSKRKPAKEPHTISLNPQDWMIGSAVCALA